MCLFYCGIHAVDVLVDLDVLTMIFCFHCVFTGIISTLGAMRGCGGRIAGRDYNVIVLTYKPPHGPKL